MSAPILVVLGGAWDDGPLLRSALALACCTGRPFRLARFGEGGGPGLGDEHLAAVSAAAGLCGAAVEGAVAGARELHFVPRSRARPIEGLELSAGGGSAVELLLLLAPALALADRASTLTLRGATHGAGAPGFHALALAIAPALGRLGFRLSASLGRAAFGGPDGELFARVEPAHAMPPLDLRHRGLLREARVLLLTGGGSAGQGLADRAVRALRRLGVSAEPEAMALPVGAAGGAELLVQADFERVRTVHAATAVEVGGPDAAVAAVEAFERHLRSGGAVDADVAEAMLVPAALLAARAVPPPEGVVPVTRFSVGRVSRPLVDGVALLPRFLPVDAALFGREGEPGEVRVAPAGASPDVLPLQREA